jgi:hypothetical protein
LIFTVLMESITMAFLQISTKSLKRASSKKRPIKKIGRYINAVPPNFHLYLYR